MFSSLQTGSLLADTDKHRLVWTQDPASTMTIGFSPVSGTDFHVKMGATTSENQWQRYDITNTRDFDGSGQLISHFVKATSLVSDTAYHYKVCDSRGCSDRMWFKTAPAVRTKPFTFVNGGDTRSDTRARLRGNRLVAKMRPLFVLFGGDYMSGTRVGEWREWLDNWQEIKSADGRMYPIVPAHGNHENGRRNAVLNAFDVEPVNAMTIGGDLMRIYLLNSEFNQSSQTQWLNSDLEQNGSGIEWLLAAYHKPIRPHTSGKSEGDSRSGIWADTFYKYRFDLISESDSHVSKYTYPIRPVQNGEQGDEGFVRDDANGTVFIGEGSWAAGARSADDDKSWTIASGSFQQIKLIKVTDKKMQVYTVGYDNDQHIDEVQALTAADQAADPLAMPGGMRIWKTPVGDALELPFHDNTVTVDSDASDADNSSNSSHTESTNAGVSASVTTGKSIYDQSCASCHGADPSKNKRDIRKGTSASRTTREHKWVKSADANKIAAYISYVLGGGNTNLSNGSNGSNGSSGGSGTAPVITGTSATFSASQDVTVGSKGYKRNKSYVVADGRSKSQELRSLFQWDVKDVPAGSKINAVNITFDVVDVSGGTYQLYGLKSAWSESSANWAAGNNLGKLITTIKATSKGKHTVTLNADGIALVQGWLDGGSNYGLVMRTGGSTDGLDVRSREGGGGAQLQIGYGVAGGSSTGESASTSLSLSPSQDVTVGSKGYKKNSSYVVADGRSKSQELRGLFQWDMKGVAAGSKVTAVNISVDVVDSSGGSYRLYAPNQGWSESSANWSSADVKGDAVAEFKLSSRGTHTIELNSRGVALVQEWLDGKTNNGLVMRNNGTTDGLDFASRESGKGAVLNITLDSGASSDTTDSTTTTGTAALSVVQDVAVGSRGGHRNTHKVEADGRTSSQEFRGLFRWDLSSVPADAQVTDATLTLKVVNRSKGAYHLHALNQTWSESSAKWATTNSAGGSIAKFTLNKTGTHTINLGSQGIALVQGWMSGQANNGLMLKTGGTSDGLDIASRESAKGAVLNLTFNTGSDGSEAADESDSSGTSDNTDG
ncbi:MAG: DNRLRE domain-containing protein, partial [Sedimenticola sp.]